MDHETDQENMVLVHMQKDEAHGLDAGQGGMEIDEETGLRSYRGWEKLIESPNVKELFNALMADAVEDGDVDPPFSTEYNEIASQLPPWEPAPGDSDPTFAELAAKGRGGDDIVVWLPSNVAVYFGKLKHGLSTNPETGLLEFGFFKEVGRVISSPVRAISSIARETKKVMPEIIRVGGTLAGFYFGGPMGAGLGNMAGSLMTGKGFGDSAISGLKNYALTSIPGMLGYGGGAAAGAAPVVDGTGKISAATMAKLNSAAPSGGGLLAGLGTAGKAGLGLGAAGQIGLHFLKDRSDKEAYQNALADRERLRREQWTDWQRMGAVSTFDPATAPKYDPIEQNPEFYNRSEEDRANSRFRAPAFIERPRYADGGHVREAFETHFRGPGKGQDDKILTKVPANTYVIDAQTTAYAGDGSTKAGAENWARWGQEMLDKNQMIPRKKKSSALDRVIDIGGRSGGGQSVDVAVSDGEGKLPPKVVASIGGGSSEKGAKILEAMIKNIRADKTRNKSGMPPKIKPLSSYLPRGAR